MANGHGGARAGAGKKKGSTSKETQRKIALLLSVEEAFRASGYDPLQCMIDIAQTQEVTQSDQIKFVMHKDLAIKYYANLGALKVDATVEHKPITVVERQFKAETNGHVRSPDAV